MSMIHDFWSQGFQQHILSIDAHTEEAKELPNMNILQYSLTEVSSLHYTILNALQIVTPTEASQIY